MNNLQTIKTDEITVDLAKLKNKKNTFLFNSNGTNSFGAFPVNNNNFPVGNIYLKLGLVGYKRERLGAFGLRHIWEKHGKELGLKDPKEVIEFIEKILVAGAVVMVDYTKDPQKPLVIESSKGMITLGLVIGPGNAPYYHVITAYDRKAHPGTVIGNI